MITYHLSLKYVLQKIIGHILHDIVIDEQLNTYFIFLLLLNYIVINYCDSKITII